jgi:hypothetical protein
MFPLFSRFVTLVTIAILSPTKFLGHLRKDMTDVYDFISSYRKDAISIFDWVVKTITSIVKIVKVYCSTGSLEEALCQKTHIQLVQSLYFSCTDKYNSALNGCLSGEWLDFEDHVLGVMTKIEEIQIYMSPRDVSIARTYLDKLQQMKVNIVARENGKNNRVQPFAFTMTGGTGVGKSHLSTSLIRHILKSNKFPVHDNTIATINLKQKHWDNVTTIRLVGNLMTQILFWILNQLMIMLHL